MAGVLEVLKASATEAPSVWTVLPATGAAHPEPRTSDSVDGMLASAARELGVKVSALRPVVLLPPGFGAGTVAGGDGVVLLADRARNGGDLGSCSAPRGDGAEDVNARATLLARAAGRCGVALRGPVAVGRVAHDLADPLKIALGGEAAPALLGERCWLERARAANGAAPAFSPSRPEAAAPPAEGAAPAFPPRACRDVLEQLLAARGAEADARRNASGPAAVPGTNGAVRWTNARDEVHVAAQLAENTKRGHVRVDVTAERLRVRVGALDGGVFKMASLVDGDLFQAVDPDKCTWDVVDSALGSAELQITLVKATPMRWLMLTR